MTPGTVGGGGAGGGGTGGGGTDGTVTVGSVTVGTLTVVGSVTVGSCGRSAAADATQPASSPGMKRANWTGRRRSRDLTANTTRKGRGRFGL
jgi:hypothetical protein